MKLSPALLANTSTHLQRIFEADNLPSTDTLELLTKLTTLVAQLLRTDLNRLLHILYRIDVEEQKVKAAMAAENEEAMARQLAQLILARELEKAYTRLKYKS
ncbi:hypothetical protein [Pontibacter arcticus]|uniref:Uncharacterized protein n=1 Tax=Pontibacter arcticus TaxID=2080288 RepID=A0A364RH51_9BACT|nr:hypothetical protein [Pontibacter arcticus]RAU83603.1 hypothetical protein DP923_00560 [Pontibacter arcticus]